MKRDHAVHMQVVTLEPEQCVAWRCVSGPWEKTGEFCFTIAPDDRGTALTFEHREWPARDDFFGHCNAKWGFFVGVSLKSYLETGRGQPHPMEPQL